MVLNRNHHKVNIFTVIQVTKFSFYKYVNASQYISSLVLALGMAMSVHQTTLVRNEMSRVDCMKSGPDIHGPQTFLFPLRIKSDKTFSFILPDNQYLSKNLT